MYDARKDKPRIENEKAIANCGLDAVCTPRTEGASNISHNKFMVKLQNDKPVCVWTGGTNFSISGIFGHSNVAHVVEDDDVAALYMQYWTALAGNPTNKKIKEEVENISDIPANPPPAGTATTPAT